MLSLPSSGLPNTFAVPQETVDLIKVVVRDKILRGEMFSSVTVTNEVKRRGATMTPVQGLGRHSEMVEVLRSMFPTEFVGYQRVTVDVTNPRTGETLSTELYAPDHADPSDYRRFSDTGWEETLRPLLGTGAKQPMLPAAPVPVAVQPQVQAVATATISAPKQRAIPGAGKTGGPVLGGHILGDD